MSIWRRLQTGALVAAMVLVAPALATPAAANTTVTAYSAGTKPVDMATNAWGTAQGAAGRQVWTEVKLPDGSWSRSQVRTANSSGGYTIPLTYGSNAAGTTTWRVSASTPSGVVRSDTFTLKRTGWVTASAASETRVGVTANTWGTAHGSAGRQVWTEVRLPDGSWSKSQSRTANSSGGFTIPLTYGANHTGTVTYRVAGSTAAGVVYSRSFSLTRSGSALNLARESSWVKIAECESGNRWSINTGNGYYGGLQFNYATWHSVDGGDFAQYPHQATREEQITVANRLYAIRGYQPWSCRYVL